ncbi:winged helix-turn-helix domain-containing protein [Sutcliffiella horikoshii]|uniref:winged helix-turn-helix domain-containing protein n=1 Tax=Sutcliffiella horikoshii TaxID=79883 RepID=UPI001CFDA766|nr:helix-turn-helix domain-containing protein [Sutcliffiella horikoshii]
MKEIFVIQTQEQLKVFSDKNKTEILNIMIAAKKPLSVKNLAQTLDRIHSKVNYHVQALKANGFIELVHKEEKGGVIEKYYEPVAKIFNVDKSLLEFSDGNDPDSELKAMHRKVITKVYNDYLEWVEESLSVKNTKEIQLMYNTVFLTEKEVKEIKAKLYEEFMEWYRTKGNNEEQAEQKDAYSLGMLLFPKTNKEDI